MKVVVLTMLFTLSVSEQFGKHVYVHQNHTWFSARKHCRQHYTDLSPITTAGEEKSLKDATKGKVGKVWIGLYREQSQWKWSGGGNATYASWDAKEPDDFSDQGFAAVCWHACEWKGWHNIAKSKMPFFCFNLIVIESKMTWDQAMWHCSQTHRTLTSLVSETENLLALSEIQHDHITEHVWIGLRYLAGRWLWVDGSPLEYEAWPKGGDLDHQCPKWKHCGALTAGGLWENWDCLDSLNFICY